MATSGPKLFRVKSGLRHGAAFVSKISLLLGVVLALIGAWALLNTEAQTLKIRPVKDFKVPEYYPNAAPGATNRLKSLLTGAEARPRPDGLVFVKEPRIQSFSEAGETQVVVKAAECVYDYKTKTASSTNTVQFQTADGKFYLEGLGFGWEQTNSNLIVSNKVRTLINRPLASAKSPQSTNAEQKIEISSDHLEYVSESKLATWRR